MHYSETHPRWDTRIHLIHVSCLVTWMQLFDLPFLLLTDAWAVPNHLLGREHCGDALAPTSSVPCLDTRLLEQLHLHQLAELLSEVTRPMGTSTGSGEKCPFPK